MTGALNRTRLTTGLEYGTYSAILKLPNGRDIADTAKYFVVWVSQADDGWLIDWQRAWV